MCVGVSVRVDAIFAHLAAPHHDVAPRTRPMAIKNAKKPFVFGFGRGAVIKDTRAVAAQLVPHARQPGQRTAARGDVAARIGVARRQACTHAHTQTMRGLK